MLRTRTTKPLPGTRLRPFRPQMPAHNALRAQLLDQAPDVMLATTEHIAGYRVTAHHGVVQAETDTRIAGSHLPNLRGAAHEVGANAVIGIRVGYNSYASDPDYYFVYGTAVTVEPIPVAALSPVTPAR